MCVNPKTEHLLYSGARFPIPECIGFLFQGDDARLAVLSMVVHCHPPYHFWSRNMQCQWCHCHHWKCCFWCPVDSPLLLKILPNNAFLCPALYCWRFYLTFFCMPSAQGRIYISGVYRQIILKCRSVQEVWAKYTSQQCHLCEGCTVL